MVGGFRYGTGRRVVGSLLLGLYNEEGLLDHVGFTSTTEEEKDRAKPVDEEARITSRIHPDSRATNRVACSRWST